MSTFGRSARGEMIDLEMMAIKSQLAAAPVPPRVQSRKTVIETLDGGKPVVEVVDDEETEVAPAPQVNQRASQVARK